MAKQILTIGYTIPTFDENYVDFYDGVSLMDADILLISPDSLKPRWEYGGWVKFSAGGGCYDVPTSSKYEEKVSHLKKEVTDFLRSGKSVFILLSKEKRHTLSSKVSHPGKEQILYSTYTKSNYDFLPIPIGNLVSASGKNIIFSGNPLFRDFNNRFKKNLEYQLYIEKANEIQILFTGNEAQILFTGKDKTKVLGAIFEFEEGGNLIVLPFINYDEEEYSEEEATQFGKTLFKTLVDIDKVLCKGGDKTPPPDWTNEEGFQLAQEQILQKEVEKKTKEIDKLNSQKDKLLAEIDEEIKLRNLLFEKGKVLENAINIALEILGYKAENYNDGHLELDHVITSPEGDRFIGESEGKDTSAVNIEKFRQLVDNIKEDSQRDGVEDPAIGILFGNGFRFTNPSERAEQFTTRCIDAKSSNCVLVRTVDLFHVAKYASESKDKRFAKSCREAIKNSVGKIVDFPVVPKGS